MENAESPQRRTVFIVSVGIIFVVLLARLLQLQFIYQDVYGKRSEENSIRQIAHDPFRGYIFDRHSKLLVDNRPSYTVTLTPSEFKEKNIPFLAQLLRVDTSFIRERYRKGKSYNRFAPIRVVRDINFPTLSLLEENRDKLPGVDYQIETKRFYPIKAKAAHLFGYTKEVSDAQLQEFGNEYRPGDLIGATGVEATYEHVLRGQKGFELLTVNAKGQLIGAYNEGKSDSLAKEGNDLILAIDADLQVLAESLFADKRGAIVAIDPNDGGVLALVSKPDYDLTQFGGTTSTSVWNALLTDSTRPMFNRATMTRYPPGSTFKMVLAAAALQEGVISPGYRVQCGGEFRYGTRIFKDHIPHGSTDAIESIQRSCNVFYYSVMLKTGLSRWTTYGEMFGFGQPTGIDMFEETSGLLPSDEYFDRVYGEGRWTQGYLVSLAIGQGEVGVSPLQMACYAGALGTRGTWFQPHVVQKIRDKQSGQMIEVKTESRKIELSDWVWNIIHQGMSRCVNEQGGTALTAKVRGVSVAGKTGTAQNPHGNDHAWFVGFAPVEHPKIAICVLVENAGFGGVVAAPIASMCIEQYLYGELIRNKPDQGIIASQEEPQQTEVRHQ